MKLTDRYIRIDLQNDTPEKCKTLQEWGQDIACTLWYEDKVTDEEYSVLKEDTKTVKGNIELLEEFSELYEYKFSLV